MSDISTKSVEELAYEKLLELDAENIKFWKALTHIAHENTCVNIENGPILQEDTIKLLRNIAREALGWEKIL